MLQSVQSSILASILDCGEMIAVAQISLYIDDSLAEKLSIAASMQNCSLSKYVAALVTSRLSEEEEKEKRTLMALRELRGSIDDPTFSKPVDLLLVADANRRYDLL